MKRLISLKLINRAVPILVIFVLITTGPSVLLAAENSIQYDHGTIFSVSQYTRQGPFRTGNNNYYAIASPTQKNIAAIASGGREDLLIYHDPTFSIKRMEPLLYHRDIAWVDEGQSVVTVASRIPPDTGGVLMRFQRSNNRFSVLKKTSVDLLGLDVSGRTIWMVGGQRYPKQKGVILKFKNGQLNSFTPPESVVYHDIDLSSDDEKKIIIVGEQGIIAFRNSTKQFQLENVPGDPFLKTVAWHPSNEYALIGGEGGKLYRFENGQLTRISANINWAIHDIAWNENGEFAILVGGIGAGDQGYWARYQDLSLKSYQLSKPLFSVEWINRNNALLGGQKVLWRYSMDQDPEELPLTASLSLSHKSIPVSGRVTLSGFGSTYQGNADSVTEYLFQYDTGDTSGWTKHPNQTITYKKPGYYKPRLLVRSKFTNQVSSDTALLKVGNVQRKGQMNNWFQNYFYRIIAFLGLLILGMISYSIITKRDKNS